MKKLDLMGGDILRRLIDDFRKEKSAKSLSSVFACLRDSEVWIPISMEFFDTCDDNKETVVVKAKELRVYPFFVEDENGGRYLTAYTWLDQMKKLHEKNNIIKLSFLECMSWALSLPKIKGIILDIETKSFHVETECFDTIAEISPTAEDEYIYAKVRFKAGGKAYYYETLRSDLTIGDKVLVPFGANDKEKIGTIVKIERYNSENLPHSYFFTKYILRKVDEEQATPRKNLVEKILLQEQAAYDIIKNLIESENLFSFDAYYNTIFAVEDRYYNRGGDWKDGEITIKQRELLCKKYDSLFNELDKDKPVLKKNSLGIHYANELFYIEPKDWLYTGDPFLWAYLARRFSEVRLPLSCEQFTALFNEFIAFIDLPKEGYEAVEIPMFSYCDLIRKITPCSVERILEKLLKNLYEFDKKMAELNQKDTFLVPSEKLTASFGKDVKITTLKGIMIQGRIVGFSVGNHNFVSLSVETDKGLKEITIDEISKFSGPNEKNDEIWLEKSEELYCFVGVSPRGCYGCNYWYIDEKKQSEPDTYVWVCMGNKNKEQIVYVDSVQYCTAGNAPYDVNKAKRILRQAQKEESEAAALNWEG